MLAAPLKGVMGEVLEPGAVELGWLLVGGVLGAGGWRWTYAPDEGAAVPEGAATPPAPPAGTLTGVPGTMGRLPDGEADPGEPDEPDSLPEGEPEPLPEGEPDPLPEGEPELEPELGEPVEPAAAGTGVAVTVWVTVTGEQTGQVGPVDAPASPGEAGEEPAGTGAGMTGELEAPATGTTGTGTLEAPATGTTGTGTLVVVAPACAGTGTAEVVVAGVAMTGGPTREVADAPASTGLGLDTIGTAITLGVLEAGQFLTVGAQLVRTTSTVLKAVASTTDGAGAETCSWTWPSDSSLAKPAMTAEPAVKAVSANE